VKSVPRSARAAAALAACLLALSACSGGGGGSDTNKSDSGQGSQPGSTSATPTQDPTALKPGTNHSQAASAYAYPAKDVHDWLWGKKAKSPTYPKKKTAFLTFDDGPTNSTPRVLRELKKAGAPATFFVIGGKQGVEHDKQAPKYLNEEIAQGSSVCVHSYSHSYHELYPGRVASAKAVSRDYDKTVKVLRGVLGKDFSTTCQRYPGGHGWKGMKPADQALQKKGASWIDWNSENGDGTDTAARSGEGRAQQALATLSSNPRVAVILMHDYRDNDATVESVAPLVKALKKKGYQFGVMS